jgi:hypothetical protein
MFCYVTMPFGLRNTGATYQRCMQHVFGRPHRADGRGVCG